MVRIIVDSEHRRIYQGVYPPPPPPPPPDASSIPQEKVPTPWKKIPTPQVKWQFNEIMVLEDFSPHKNILFSTN